MSRKKVAIPFLVFVFTLCCDGGNNDYGGNNDCGPDGDIKLTVINRAECAVYIQVENSEHMYTIMGGAADFDNREPGWCRVFVYPVGGAVECDYEEIKIYEGDEVRILDLGDDCTCGSEDEELEVEELEEK